MKATNLILLSTLLGCAPKHLDSFEEWQAHNMELSRRDQRRLDQMFAESKANIARNDQYIAGLAEITYEDSLDRAILEAWNKEFPNEHFYTRSGRTLGVYEKYHSEEEQFRQSGRVIESIVDPDNRQSEIFRVIESYQFNFDAKKDLQNKLSNLEAAVAQLDRYQTMIAFGKTEGCADDTQLLRNAYSLAKDPLMGMITSDNSCAPSKDSKVAYFVLGMDYTQDLGQEHNTETYPEKSIVMPDLMVNAVPSTKKGAGIVRLKMVGEKTGNRMDNRMDLSYFSTTQELASQIAGYIRSGKSGCIDKDFGVDLSTQKSLWISDSWQFGLQSERNDEGKRYFHGENMPLDQLCVYKEDGNKLCHEVSWNADMADSIIGWETNTKSDSVKSNLLDRIYVDKMLRIWGTNAMYGIFDQVSGGILENGEQYPEVRRMNSIIWEARSQYVVMEKRIDELQQNIDARKQVYEGLLKDRVRGNVGSILDTPLR